MVRAKFKVQSITQHENGKTVEMRAVITGSDENKEFFKWTPNASISLSIMNDEAAKQFEVTKEYYVDFTPAN